MAYLKWMAPRWPWIWPVMGVIWVLQSLTNHGPLRWLFLALAAAYAVLWPVARRQQRAAVARYRAALSRPPGPGA